MACVALVRPSHAGGVVLHCAWQIQEDEPTAFVTYEKFEKKMLEVLETQEFAPDTEDVLLQAFRVRAVGGGLRTVHTEGVRRARSRQRDGAHLPMHTDNRHREEGLRRSKPHEAAACGRGGHAVPTKGAGWCVLVPLIPCAQVCPLTFIHSLRYSLHYCGQGSGDRQHLLRGLHRHADK